MIEKKVKYITYLAGFIESKPLKAGDWRKEILEKLNSPDLLIYCPIHYEAKKTGRPTGEHIKYVAGLKQAGHWDKFGEEMGKIWWGDVKPGVSRYEVIRQFKYRSLIDGNTEKDLGYWGDFEAVARSSFILLNYHNEIPTWGTPAEAIVAFFLNIPIYVISNVSKTEMNSSLLWWANETNGQVFYSLNECVKAIKEKYNLKITEEEKVVEEPKGEKK